VQTDTSSVNSTYEMYTTHGNGGNLLEFEIILASTGNLKFNWMYSEFSLV